MGKGQRNHEDTGCDCANESLQHCLGLPAWCLSPFSRAFGHPGDVTWHRHGAGGHAQSLTAYPLSFRQAEFYAPRSRSQARDFRGNGARHCAHFCGASARSCGGIAGIRPQKFTQRQYQTLAGPSVRPSVYWKDGTTSDLGRCVNFVPNASYPPIPNRPRLDQSARPTYLSSGMPKDLDELGGGEDKHSCAHAARKVPCVARDQHGFGGGRDLQERHVVGIRQFHGERNRRDDLG